MNSSNRTYIVSGAAGGIGGATVARLLRAGGQVLATDISQRRLQALVERHPEHAEQLAIVRADLTSEPATQAVVRACLERFGALHGIANIAGGMVDIKADSMDRPLQQIGHEYFRRTYALNTESAFLMCKAAEPHFAAQGYGKIVNIASLAAFANRHDLGDVAYNPAKAAVVALTQTLSLLCGRQGIRVNCVAPGLVRSDKVKETFGAAYVQRHIDATALGKLATVDDEAEAIAFLLEPASDMITGEVLRVSAGTR